MTQSNSINGSWISTNFPKIFLTWKHCLFPAMGRVCLFYRCPARWGLGWNDATNLFFFTFFRRSSVWHTQTLTVPLSDTLIH